MVCGQIINQSASFSRPYMEFCSYPRIQSIVETLLNLLWEVLGSFIPNFFTKILLNTLNLCKPELCYTTTFSNRLTFTEEKWVSDNLTMSVSGKTHFPFIKLAITS